jgi:hypothetical protein
LLEGIGLIMGVYLALGHNHAHWLSISFIKIWIVNMYVKAVALHSVFTLQLLPYSI